ncbi:hypothetical protein [Streptomyces sp. NPDC020817]|uniref:hypothetical protein n=1 Tax=Streptomyces sp. NPDC020817 TaxID=3365095 RepID=UPI00378AC035
MSGEPAPDRSDGLAPAHTVPAALIAAAAFARSRLVLRAHAPAQLLAGTALGGTSALIFLLLG